MCWNFYPEDRFSSYEEYVKYLKEKGLALEAPEGTHESMTIKNSYHELKIKLSIEISDRLFISELNNLNENSSIQEMIDAKTKILGSICDMISKDDRLIYNNKPYLHILNLEKFIEDLPEEKKEHLNLNYILNFQFETPIYGKEWRVTNNSILKTIRIHKLDLDVSIDFGMKDDSVNPPEMFYVNGEDVNLNDMISLHALVENLLKL